MFYKTLKAFLLAVALAADGSVAKTVRGGAGREEIVVTYDNSVSMDEVFDVLEEAKARFHRQLSCTRGMVVDVDEEGRKLIESIEGMSIGVSPHTDDENKDVDGEGQSRRLDDPDYVLHPYYGEEHGFQPVHTCDYCPGHAAHEPYILTYEQIDMIKGMVRDEITAGQDCHDCPFSGNCEACGSTLDQTMLPEAEFMVGYHLYNSNTNGEACDVDRMCEILASPDDTPTGTFEPCPVSPFECGSIGSDSFDGSLAQSAAALVRNVFHDCGTMDVHGNYKLSGCNGCVSLKSNKNRGLETANEFLKDLKKSLYQYHYTYITMADLIVLASTVAIEETVKRFQYTTDYACIYQDFENENGATEQEKIDFCLGKTRFLEHLNIPFRYGREDIWQSESYKCDCELTELPTPEPVLSTDNVWTRQELNPTTLHKLDWTLEEYCIIIGVHSIGTLKTEFSGYNGQWNFGSPDEFSNAFYSFGGTRNLRKRENIRQMTDYNGDPLDVAVTEWVLGGGRTPFIFLNTDVTCLYDFAYHNEYGIPCNVTREDQAGPFDVTCPKYHDTAAKDFAHFGTDAGYTDWLAAFSKIYRRMTDELVPCGTLRLPGENFKLGKLCYETGYGCGDEKPEPAYYPDGLYQSVRDDDDGGVRRDLAAADDNNNMEVKHEDQQRRELFFSENRYGYLNLDCHDLDEFCEIYGILYQNSICQQEDGHWMDFRYGFGFEFSRHKICRTEFDTADVGSFLGAGGTCTPPPPGPPQRKLFFDDEFADVFNGLVGDDPNPCQVLEDVAIVGPSYDGQGLLPVPDRLEIYQIVGCEPLPERRDLKEEEEGTTAAVEAETEQESRKLQGIESIILGQSIGFTTPKKGTVYTYCPFEQYTKISNHYHKEDKVLKGKAKSVKLVL